MNNFKFTLFLAACFLFSLKGTTQIIKSSGNSFYTLSMELDEVKEKTIEFKYDSVVNGIKGKALYFSGHSSEKIQLQLNATKANELFKNNDFTVELWVQSKGKNDTFQVIASNKDWHSGEIKDFTDNRYFGISRTSGANKGWAIICQPDGSWAWNIGNGEYRKDYRPTAPRQKINEGEWHQIAFSVNRKLNEARLYFDGRNVAVYYMGPVKEMDSGLPVYLATDGKADSEDPSFEGAIDEFEIYDYVLSDTEIAENYIKLEPAAKLPGISKEKVKSLNIMAWNIWHGGRRHGREIGPQQVISFIKDTNTDIVLMQETYGSGPLIADALGYYFYLASANISVMSKYPIRNTQVKYHELWSGIAKIQLSKDQFINVASIWLHYLPAWKKNSKESDATEELLIAGEEKNRHREIKIILKGLEEQIHMTEDIPFIMGGDFNSPSHLDWTAQTKDWHNGLIVKWPVSVSMHNAGFTDAFREINPNLNYRSATMKAIDLTYKIDYIYYKGRSLKAVTSDMHFKYKGIWPSDHPAVTTTFKLK